MAENEEEVEAYRLLSAARELLGRVVGAIKYSELFDTTYAVSSRLKKTDRLHEKIATRRAGEKPDYRLADVTDIIGIRFISLYRRDVTQYVLAVLQMVTGDRQLNPNQLEGMQLVELKSYVSNALPDADPLNLELGALYESDFADRVGRVPFQTIARSRYSSVHMVLKTTYEHEGRQHVVPLELQFRSVFEDAWGEIDHKLLYELDRSGERVDKAQREAMAQHMTVLKKMVDAVADYADVIRRTVVVSRDKPASIERNLDDAEYITELAPRAGLPQQLTDALSTLLDEKTALDRQLAGGRPDVSALLYIDVANKLRLLMPGIEAALAGSADKATRTILFSVRMEEALCRLLSGDPQQIRVAAESYSGLTRDFPSFPAGWFRSAQAHQRISDIGDPRGTTEAAAAAAAFQHYGRALVELDRCMKMRTADRILSVSPEQVKYIGGNAARLQGFVKWRLSDRRRRAAPGGATQKDLADVVEAYEVTKAALLRERGATGRLKLVNNVIYYAADAYELGRALGTGTALLDEAELRQLLEQMKGRKDQDVMWLDTIVRGSRVIGDEDAARQAARRILDLNADGAGLADEKAGSPYVSEARERAVRHAWTVVRGSENT